jgi:glycosyltransferase involved in cell wall biosynthesis
MDPGHIAILICSNVIGGHELQAAELGKSLAKHASVTFLLNKFDHAPVFEATGLEVRILDGLLLEPGKLPFQFFNGWRHRSMVRELVKNYDHIIVSAGTVEAGISAGFCFYNYKSNSLYLPSFCDRVPIWGWPGYIYNCILAASCKFFDQLIVINKIQARIIYAFTSVPTLVVENQIRKVTPSNHNGPSRLVFVGRLDAIKRINELIVWLDSEANPIKQLLLIGDGPLRQELEELAKNCRYLNCSFLGWMSPNEQDQLIRSSDVLVLNSLVEGEPMVIREGRLRGMNFAVRNINGVRGVTLKKERFNSQKELMGILSRLSSQSKHQEGFDWKGDQIKNEKRRLNSILMLHSRIFAVNPKTKNMKI